MVHNGVNVALHVIAGFHGPHIASGQVFTDAETVPD